MDCYILNTFLLVIILLFKIAITCYHYANHKSKQKKYWHKNNKKCRKITTAKIFDSTIMLRFGKITVTKEEFYGAKK